MQTLYQRLLNLTGDGVYRYMLDDGVVIMANKGLVEILDLKCRPEDLVGRKLHDLLTYTEPEGSIRTRLQEHGELRRYEYHFRTLSGKNRWVRHDAMLVTHPGSGRKIVETIVRDITLRREADKNIRRLNEELESRVKLRTAQYEAANTELEAFSYSVAHDLRSPLRAIDGFSRILLTEHQPILPPEAQRYLKLISDQAQQMARLVDDLLSLAHVGRQAIAHQTIAPAKLVEDALKDMASERNGRNIEVRIGRLPDCLADPGLLKLVYVNLLANALKFTRKRDPAIIEVGSLQKNQDNIFFVKDNGVGFDMRYVHKLFGVFHRLHRADEYEGTGIGLATVQRIINRHGGRVWAESQLEVGTTFYFTLGNGAESASDGKDDVEGLE
jgi:PAS domain S-box-containing protein